MIEWPLQARSNFAPAQNPAQVSTPEALTIVSASSSHTIFGRSEPALIVPSPMPPMIKVIATNSDGDRKSVV